MAQVAQIPLFQKVTTTVLANVRAGAPSISGPVVRKLPPMTSISVSAVVAGDTVQGNSLWLRLQSEDSYIWAGACTFAEPVIPDAAVESGLESTPLVVDLSHGDGLISFDDAKAAGVQGIIHKATTGGTGRDNAYPLRVDAALSAGLLWGAYHWGTAAPIDDQVRNFLSATGLDNPNETNQKFLIAVDFESTVGDQMTLDGLRQFCQQIADATHRRPLIYGGGLLKSMLGPTADDFLGSHRLWLAQYGPNPTVQRSWRSYWLWQFTDGESGPATPKVPGLPGDAKGRLDCDHFPNGLDVLRSEWADSIV